MNISLKILGTASAMPISDRNPSAQALEVNGRLFLIDCGEGTQQQMRRNHVSFAKLQAIFLSHIHGDHLFGIYGLLSTIGMLGRTQKLDIYAPPAFGPILKFFLSYFGEGLNFEIEHHPLTMKDPQTILEVKSLKVTAFPLNHKIECFGFRFDEVMTERRLAANPDAVPHSYAYCSDTAPFPELASWLEGVRVLYHEATYTNDLDDKAQKYYHSTTGQAARVALDAGVRRLIVGHYSTRIADFDRYISECREVFPETYCSQDGDVIEI